MRNIAIIPARSGSKGLKDKNIKLLGDKPLIAYSIDSAKDSGIFDEIMVSTDSEKYAEVAKEYGASVPFLRSDELSGDSAGSWDVVKEVLQGYKTLGKVFDTVCLLQPTSPLRKPEDIVLSYDLLKQMNGDSITSVCEMDHSPLWSMILPEDGSLADFRRNLKSVPRQKLSTYHRINGAIYIRKIEYTENAIGLKEQREYAYIMNRGNSVDIDTIDDFELAEFYLTRRIK